MTDYTDLAAYMRRLGSSLQMDNATNHDGDKCHEAAAAIAALEAEVARKDAAIKQALDEAVADDMDGWYAGLRAALTDQPVTSSPR